LFNSAEIFWFPSKPRLDFLRETKVSFEKLQTKQVWNQIFGFSLVCSEKFYTSFFSSSSSSLTSSFIV